MRVEVTTNIEIARPLADVASYAFEPTNAPQWYANIKSVRWRTAPPVAEGSEMDFVAHFLGRELAYTYRVMALTGNRLVMCTAEGPFPIYQLQATGPFSTRVCLINCGDPRVLPATWRRSIRRLSSRPDTRVMPRECRR